MGYDGTGTLLLVNTGTPSVPIWTPVAGQRGLSFSMDTAAIDATSKDDGISGTFLPGRNTGTLTLEHLYEIGDAGFLALRTAQETRQLIKIREQELGTDQREANALVTNITRSLPDSDAGTVSVALQISGSWAAV